MLNHISSVTTQTLIIFGQSLTENVIKKGDTLSKGCNFTK